MASSNDLFEEMLNKIQNLLDEYKCKSEIKISEKNAILYGKFSYNMDRFNIVVHVNDESFVPKTLDAGLIENKIETRENISIPSLEFKFFKAVKSNCSVSEQTAIKEKFIAEAEKIGKEYINKLNQ